MSGERTPTLEQVERLYSALTGLNSQASSTPDKARDLDEQVFPYFANLADACADIRLCLDKIQGWGPIATISLRSAVAEFDQLAIDWGWQRLAVPEPERTRYADLCRERFSLGG